MDSDDYAYFSRRAATELDLARRAADDKAAAAHRGLADAYRARATAMTMTPPAVYRPS